jgi:hypothetical protein
MSYSSIQITIGSWTYIRMKVQLLVPLCLMIYVFISFFSKTYEYTVQYTRTSPSCKQKLFPSHPFLQLLH